MNISRISIPLCCALAGLVLAACSGVVPTSMTLGDPASSWQPALTSSEIAIVQEEFPNFIPEWFAPGTDPTNRLSLNSGNFAPAHFFGPANPQGFKPTPYGIPLETNGYDQSVPATLPAAGTYFSPANTQLPFTLGPITEYPLNYLEGKVDERQIHIPNGPPLTIDLSKTQVDPSYVDSLMLDLQSRFATIFPQIAKVDPRSCQIVIEPSVFFDHIGSNPPTITNGYTSGMGGNPGPITIHVAVFYITADGTVYNWADALIDQAVMFYMTAAGIVPPASPKLLVRAVPAIAPGVRTAFFPEFKRGYRHRLWG
jgi:hypothetical protein